MKIKSSVFNNINENMRNKIGSSKGGSRSMRGSASFTKTEFENSRAKSRDLYRWNLTEKTTNYCLLKETQQNYIKLILQIILNMKSISNMAAHCCMLK